MNPQVAGKQKATARASLFLLLKPYRRLVMMLAVLTIAGNGLNLVVPKLISHAIDSYMKPGFVLSKTVLQFSAVAFLVLTLTYLQSITQTYVSERVARDLRTRLAGKIARQSYSSVENLTAAKLLTNLTSDVDGVKLFVSQAVASIVASLFLIGGASVMLLTINWRLGICVLGVVPVVGVAFLLALRRVRVLFRKGQEAIDWLNRVINESILGATLIRILNSQDFEYRKFKSANTEARDIGLSILRIMSGIIPAMTLAVNLATIIILLLGGRFVIFGRMSLGDFSAFNTYLAILVFPIVVLGFMSNVIAQASTSYMRLSAVLFAKDEEDNGTLRHTLRGDVEMNNVSLTLGNKEVLRNITLAATLGTRTAIIGPTAGGKTQMLYVLIGLLSPSSGTVAYDGELLANYEKESLRRQIGFVFQDSVLFNLTLRENIAFSEEVSEEALNRAIVAAELQDFIATLPDGLDTIVSERGNSLSGGQKQRVMLARALALQPKILLLDDFTARVDTTTEQAILKNIQEQYPDITLISVTQKIGSVEDYHQIVLLMEGEILATGTHAELMSTCPEYVQIYESQRSTNYYELQA
jgi:ATP-binding cassette, subfamily B, bacterial